MNEFHGYLGYAREALRQITDEPDIYGITKPWGSVEEWINFELEGATGDDFRTEEQRNSIIAAMRTVATLEELNHPFTHRES
jgi:hypothetical protein